MCAHPSWWEHSLLHTWKAGTLINTTHYRAKPLGKATWFGFVREDRLYVQPIEIIQEVEDTLYVLNGITDEGQVVTNMLNVVTDGMLVRTGMN